MPGANNDSDFIKDKNISTVSVAVFCLAIYRLVIVDGLMTTIWTALFSSATNFLFYFVNFILPFFASFLFWKVRKSGWILVAFYIAYSLTEILALFIREVLAPNSEIFIANLTILTPCLALLPVIFFLFRERMVKTFQISLQEKLLVICAAVLISVAI